MVSLSDASPRVVTLCRNWLADVLQWKGARNQARMHSKKLDRRKTLARRLKTYERHATRYNSAHRPQDALVVPSLQTIHSMSISDPFWEMAGLSHPDEDWAVDVNTRAGIDAFRTERSCLEELRRIARELRQLLQWAVDYATRIKELGQAADAGVYLLLTLSKVYSTPFFAFILSVLTPT